MDNVNTKMMIGGAIAVAAAGIAYFALTPRGGSKKPTFEEETKDVTKGEAVAAAPVPAPAAASHKGERTFVLIKPDGV